MFGRLAEQWLSQKKVAECVTWMNADVSLCVCVWEKWGLNETNRGKATKQLAHSLTKVCSFVFTDFCVVSIISWKAKWKTSAVTPSFARRLAECVERHCLNKLTHCSMISILTRKRDCGVRGMTPTDTLTPCASRMMDSFWENLSKHSCRTS